MNAMFNGCTSLTSIPLLDTSKVTNMQNTFRYTALTSIPALNASKVTGFYSTFENTTTIEEIHMTGMKVSFDIHYSTKFTREALLEIINNCATLTSAQTLTMGSTNLAKLTKEDQQMATNKGWTLK
jgi:surface protein